MKRNVDYNNLLLLLFVILIANSCKKSTPNQPPVANAGTVQTITLPTNSVTLDGSLSTDPDGSIASFSWTKKSGPSAGTITSPTAVSTTVTGLEEGTYVFQLSITDNKGATGLATVQVTVNPEPRDQILTGTVWKYAEIDDGINTSSPTVVYLDDGSIKTVDVSNERVKYNLNGTVQDTAHDGTIYSGTWNFINNDTQYQIVIASVNSIANIITLNHSSFIWTDSTVVNGRKGIMVPAY